MMKKRKKFDTGNNNVQHQGIEYSGAPFYNMD